MPPSSPSTETDDPERGSAALEFILVGVCISVPAPKYPTARSSVMAISRRSVSRTSYSGKPWLMRHRPRRPSDRSKTASSPLM